MTRLGQLYVALVLTVSGGFAGAAIALHWASQSWTRAIPGGMQ